MALIMSKETHPSTFSGSLLRFAAFGFLVFSSWACGGANSKPAAEPVDPVLLEPAAEDEQAPSSPQVEEAINAIKAGQFQKAESILAKAVVETPDDPQAAFFYGVALEGVDKAQLAQDSYRRAIEISPQLLEAPSNLSNLLIQLEKYEEALAVADKGLTIAPKYPPLLANRAAALDMLQKPEALAAYEALLIEAPDDAANRFNYAVVLFLNERQDDARAQLAKLQTQDAALLIDVAALYTKLKDLPGCVKTLDGAIASKKSADLLSRRARCKMMQKDLKGAEADLREAIATEPSASVGYFYLGIFLKKAGPSHQDEAIASLKKAVEVGQGDDFAKAAEKVLAKK